MRSLFVLLTLFCSQSLAVDWGMKLDIEKLVQQKVDEVDNSICNLNEKIDSLLKRIEQLEKQLPQPNAFREQGLPKAEKKSEPEKKAKSKITVYTLFPDKATGKSSCLWCDRLRADKLKEAYEKQGWEWIEIESQSGTVPRFEVCVKDKCYIKSGYFAGEPAQRIAAFHAFIKSLLEQEWTYDKPDNYKSGWNYPGDIREHLQGPPHYADVAGLTKEQCEQLHDRLHNEITGAK
jgi:hypothetical protein